MGVGGLTILEGYTMVGEAGQQAAGAGSCEIASQLHTGRREGKERGRERGTAKLSTLKALSDALPLARLHI